MQSLVTFQRPASRQRRLWTRVIWLLGALALAATLNACAPAIPSSATTPPVLTAVPDEFIPSADSGQVPAPAAAQTVTGFDVRGWT